VLSLAAVAAALLVPTVRRASRAVAADAAPVLASPHR
jgi:hypothetical protein